MKRVLSKIIVVSLFVVSLFSMCPCISFADSLNGWVYKKNNWYYYQHGLLRNGWLYEKGKWYFLYSNGKMATGWTKVDGKWYYFYSNGIMAVNTTIDGYKIDDNGEYKK